MVKISIIGSGNIGSNIAFLASQREYINITMLDINKDFARGKALDIGQMMSIIGKSYRIDYSDNDYSKIRGSDVVIVTAGLSRKPGMSRDDLVDKNAKIIQEIALSIAENAPSSLVIVITNPLDAMVYLMQKASKLPEKKVIGMSGALDGARFSYFLSQATNISIENIQTLVMGNHGDTMLPLIQYSTIAGIQLSQAVEMGIITNNQLIEVIEKTRNGGAEIVECLKNFSAYYSPAAAVMDMVDAYILDKRKIFTVSAYLNGQYNVKDLYIGVPVIIGKGGIEKILNLPLGEDEKIIFDKAVKNTEELRDRVKSFV